MVLVRTYVNRGQKHIEAGRPHVSGAATWQRCGWAGESAREGGVETLRMAVEAGYHNCPYQTQEHGHHAGTLRYSITSSRISLPFSTWHVARWSAPLYLYGTANLVSSIHVPSVHRPSRLLVVACRSG